MNKPQQFSDFINLPWQLFKKDITWVPPLRMTVNNYLDTKKNPFYQHSKQKLWNVYDGKQCLGRIVGIIDLNHNNFHQENVVYWGFFEAVDNQEVSNLLFNAVATWGKEQGMAILRGPMSPSTNHECGMQITGFDTDPFFMMPTNPSYYPQRVEQYGFHKAKDLYAWLADLNQHTLDERRLHIANKQIEKKRYAFRCLNLKDFANEVSRLFGVYNDAWEKNWGFVPMTQAEFEHMAKELKGIIDPRLCIIVEIDGEPVGFSLVLPNLNQVIKRIRNGKLLPTGLFKLIWHTKIRPSINSYRVITLGVKKQYQALGLAAILYYKTEEILRKLGARRVEMSWVLEDNHAMNAAIQSTGAQCYKTYRIYEMPILSATAGSDTAKA